MRGLLRTGPERAPGIAARIKTEWVRGLDRNHCALSPGIRARFAPEYAVLTSCELLNVQADNAALWNQMNVASNGVTFLELSRLIEQTGLSAVGVNAGLEYLHQVGGPTILWLNGDSKPYPAKHFAVYAGRDSSGRNILIDSTVGLAAIDDRYLSRIWNGPCIIVQK